MYFVIYSYMSMCIAIYTYITIYKFATLGIETVDSEPDMNGQAAMSMFHGTGDLL